MPIITLPPFAKGATTARHVVVPHEDPRWWDYTGRFRGDDGEMVYYSEVTMNGGIGWDRHGFVIIESEKDRTFAESFLPTINTDSRTIHGLHVKAVAFDGPDHLNRYYWKFYQRKRVVRDGWAVRKTAENIVSELEK